MEFTDLKKHMYFRTDYYKRVPESIQKILDNDKTVSIVESFLGIYEVFDGLTSEIKNLKPRIVSRKSGHRDHNYTIILDDLLGKKLGILTSSNDTERAPKYSGYTLSRYNKSAENIAREKLIQIFPKFDWNLYHIIFEYIKSGYLDEKALYRLFALNEMIEHAEIDETFGSYVKIHHETIMRKLLELDFEIYSKWSETLLSNYRGNVVEYWDRNAEINDAIFGEFSKEDIQTALSDVSRYSGVTITNYSKRLPDAVSSLKLSKTIDPEKQIENNLSKAFIKSVEANPRIFESDVDFSILMEDFGEFTKVFKQPSFNVSKGLPVVNFYDSPAKKHSISENLLKVADKVSPVDLLCVLWAMGTRHSAFRSTSLSQSMEIVEAALNGSDAEGFVKTVAELVLEYSGVKASYGEWKSELKIGNMDYSLGVELLMGMMVKGNKISSESEKVIDFREKYKGKYIA